MTKLIMALLGLKLLLSSRGSGKAAATGPPRPPDDPDAPDEYGGRAGHAPPRERGVAYADLLPGEPAGLGPPSPNYPDGVPLPPPAPDASAEGYDDTSWRGRYPAGPPSPNTNDWPGQEGGHNYDLVRGADHREVAWARWRVGVYWRNPLNAALRADLSVMAEFMPVDVEHDQLTFGVLDEIAIRALRVLYENAPVPLVQAPWRGCQPTRPPDPVRGRPAWGPATSLVAYRMARTQFVRPELLSTGSPAAALLNSIFRDVRKGSVVPTCTGMTPAELYPPLPVSQRG